MAIKSTGGAVSDLCLAAHAQVSVHPDSVWAPADDAGCHGYAGADIRLLSVYAAKARGGECHASCPGEAECAHYRGGTRTHESTYLDEDSWTLLGRESKRHSTLPMGRPQSMQRAWKIRRKSAKMFARQALTGATWAAH